MRYQVKDVSRSVAFYTQQLGFKLDQKNPPAFAQVSIGNFKLILSGPGASGSRTMPDGRKQEPGGWNRVILHVADLPARTETLKKAGLHFRNQNTLPREFRPRGVTHTVLTRNAKNPVCVARDSIRR